MKSLWVYGLRSTVYCLLSIVVFVLFSLFPLTKSVFAQGINNVSNNMIVDDADAGPGDILSFSQGKVSRSNTPYDSSMLGVIVEFPIISVGERTDNTKAVLTSGMADVKVTAANGEIKVGDFITSTDKPGIGQKATIPGFVLGKALTGYSDTSQDGVVSVVINIGVFAQNPNVSGLLGQALNSLSIGLASTENFPLMLRYVAAALIGIVTFIIAGFSFIRFMRSGLEAIGRNPLARSTIIFGMFVNAVIVLIMAIAGFGIAFAIIAF